ncbi:hypothetical protein CMO88_00840 [Candidatus Woesearchaeota archaeon]|nr:hypothetical protein [Candidatus Woesearchaeota archaeon]|tara:strand:- start:26608 stop:26898 length:291 start_codon:yes stop_codon:yes gene_type:complete
MITFAKGGGKKMQPETKFKAGGVSATIWQNTSAKGNYATVTLSRSYMDKDKNWKETNSYKVTDLPKVALVLSKAYEHLQLNKKATQTPQVMEQKIV